ncbi:MAG: FkbM family methyltransferase [Acidimicrobiales bacterium]|nr:FkbM family methyltransferase [Acidimicrobiales bacterium]
MRFGVTMSTLRVRARKGLAALRHPVYRRALRHGTLPVVEHDPLLRIVGKCMTVLDVGANIGQFAVVARRWFPNARIVSFEPLPEAGARAARIFSGDDGFELLPLALGKKLGRSELHVTSSDDSSSLLAPGPRQVEEYPGTAEIATITVELSTLDEVLRTRPRLAQPVLLKLDTQGTELDVLEGATALLDEVDWVLVEVSFVELYVGQASASDISTHLFARGYRLRAVNDIRYSALSGEPVQADFLFERTNRAP